MNPSLSFCLALSSIVGAGSISAQEDRRPEPPPPGLPPGAGAPGRPPLPPEPRERGPGERGGREGGERRREHGPGEGRDFRGPGPDRGRDREGGPHGGQAPGGFGDGPRGERYERRERIERELKPTPYLGVITSQVPAVLSAQLGTPGGFGLVVDDVLAEGPAKAAGVEQFDVLLLLNEQQLVSPDQLASLVRGMGTGHDVTLTVVRKGQQQKLSAKIGEKALPSVPALRFEQRIVRPWLGGGSRESDGPIGRGGDFRSPGDGGRRGGDPGRGFEDRIREHQETLRKHHQRLEEWQKNPTGTPPPPPAMPEMPPGRRSQPVAGVRPADILRDVGPRGGDHVKTEWSQGDSRWVSNHARLMMRDDDGEIAISVTDGKRTLTAKNDKGETVFTGPVDTEEQRNAVPEPYRGKLAKLHPPMGGDVVRAAPGRGVEADRPVRREQIERRLEVQ